MQQIRYDELQAGDIVLFHGARERVVTVNIMPAPADWNTAEKSVTFSLAPADPSAVEILGRFYSDGTYGGIGSLPIALIERGA